MHNSDELAGEDGTLEALITALADNLRTMPLDSPGYATRTENIRLAAEGVAEYGIDSDSLVRYGMTDHIMVLVLSGLLLEPILRDAEFVPPGREGLPQWRQVLALPDLAQVAASGIRGESEVAEVAAAFSRATPAIKHWIQHAPFDDIVHNRPPTRTELEAWRVEDLASSDVVEPYVWLVERSTETDLAKWEVSSLLREFQLLDGTGQGEFGERVTVDSARDLGAVAIEIVRQQLQGTSSNAGGDTRDLFWKLQEQAKSLLLQNRHHEASALFEFYLGVQPEDPPARNNLGFCLIPVKPADALHHLEIAGRSDAAARPLNVYNQVCCLLQLNRLGDALSLAENYWQRQRTNSNWNNHGFLWRRKDDGWELYFEANAEQALATLVAEVANELGVSERATRWLERATEAQERAQQLPADFGL